MSAAYLLALLLSLAGLLVADWRFKLALFSQRSRSLRVLGISLVFFVAWDILGIALKIFFAGNSPYMSGVFLGPEFPLEEIFFLLLLCYTTLLVWRGLHKI